VSAAGLALGSDSVIYGVSALQLWGVDLPWQLRDENRIHVLRLNHTNPSERPDFCSHRGRLLLEPENLDGIWVTHPVEAWMQVANELNVDDLIHLGDALMRRKYPLVTPDELYFVVSRSDRRRGVVRARFAVEHSRAGTDSWAETTTRLILVRGGLACPEVNLKVTDGVVTYYLDMAYADAMVAVEYDGAIHVADAAIMQRDRTRRRWLEDHGWRVISVTALDLQTDAAGVVQSVRKSIEDAESRVATASARSLAA